MPRVTAVTDGSPSSTSHFADYTYLGAGTIIKSARPLVSGGLSLTCGASGSYNGLDQWGRIVDQLWANDSSVARDDYTYDYDAAGNRTKRENVLADAASTNLSETYLYDEVYRLIGTDRGHFSGVDFVWQSHYQQWTLDGMGNFSEFDEDSDQDGDVDLEQSREHSHWNTKTKEAVINPEWHPLLWEVASPEFQYLVAKKASFDVMLWHELVGHGLFVYIRKQPGYDHPDKPENYLDKDSEYDDPVIQVENMARKCLGQRPAPTQYHRRPRDRPTKEYETRDYRSPAPPPVDPKDRPRPQMSARP